ncbi:MAG: DUF3127 domain-containing protein [Bacteroidetes bacterium]|nr:DUF3127 domain-containing protein [Bacteroidota bacterium]
MSFELSGILILKGELQQISNKFRKREFVIEKKETNQNQEFVDYVKFQLTQDRCDLVEPFEINDKIKISFNIRGNRWEKEGKVNYFTNLDAWRIEKTVEAEEEIPPPPPEDDLSPPPEELNDLPF